jgi:4Fe-4S binding domain protein|uniref:Coenzyme F420 hydrogenase/dehydrogenase, beta subunit C-terminal domain n=1 Tax=Bacteroides uniformis TaxID=820 RepID=UPI0040268361
MEMVSITDISKCCGCGACSAVCPRHAIVMQPDAMGFLYPVVDSTKCVECGLCEKVCSFHKDYDKQPNLSTPVAFAARHRNIKEIETSRSGAAFIALSDWILENGGVVYGAGYSTLFRVVHKKAMTPCERDEFKGSKYTQSDLNDVFRMVQEDLKAGKKVLFSGTPCQTAGLSSFIGQRLRHLLYLADIICHGVASPFVWRDYLNYLEAKERKRLSAVNFRDKEKFGWSGLHKESFFFVNDPVKHTYSYTFYSDLMLRESCYVCPFANLTRPSDITLGDFWGWEKAVPDFNIDDKGCSLILCNTIKGKLWLEAVQEKLTIIPIDIKDCMQPNLQRPTPVNPLSKGFKEDYVRNGFAYAMKKYGNAGLAYQIRRCLNFAKRIVRKVRRKQ